MSGKGFSIVFSSRTGNTAELAEAVRESAAGRDVRVFRERGWGRRCRLRPHQQRNPRIGDSVRGLWTNQGVADQAAQKLLGQLRNRKIFLFGTAGFGGSEAYFQAILGKTKAFIDDSNTVIGTYMCQGKMPLSVRERYVKMKEQPDHMPNIDAMIENFDKALAHPRCR